MTEIRIITADDVRRVADPPTMIASQRAAFEALGRGDALQPERIIMDGPGENATFCYAARVGTTGDVCKFGAVAPGNVERGLPSISAVIVVLDHDTGVPVALIDGTSVTMARTAAASAVAIEALAAPGTRAATIVGTGVQAEAHVDALAHVLDLERVRLAGPETERGRELAAALSARHPFAVEYTEDVVGAVEGSPLVVSCTTATEPLYPADAIAAGATVVSIGSFAAGRCEVPQELLPRTAAIVVDHVEVALEHAGPVVEAVAAGTLAPDALLALGDVLVGTATARTGADDIIYYNSVGIGVQDAAAATAILAGAPASVAGGTVTL